MAELMSPTDNTSLWTAGGTRLSRRTVNGSALWVLTTTLVACSRNEPEPSPRDPWWYADQLSIRYSYEGFSDYSPTWNEERTYSVEGGGLLEKVSSGNGGHRYHGTLGYVRVTGQRTYEDQFQRFTQLGEGSKPWIWHNRAELMVDENRGFYAFQVPGGTVPGTLTNYFDEEPFEETRAEDFSVGSPLYLSQLRHIPLDDDAAPESGSFTKADEAAIVRERNERFGNPIGTGHDHEYSGSWTLQVVKPSKVVNKITFWINAFIPGVVPGLTVEVPGTDQTAVGALLWQDCFHTDQRSFSADLDASSRMQSRLTVDLATGDWEEEHRCDETVEVDCESGEIEGRGNGKTDRMGFTFVNYDEETRTYEWELKAASSNPLVLPSRAVGDIDYQGTLSITVEKDRRAATAGFGGFIDTFPAFEIYCAANDEEPVTFLQRMPGLGKKPWKDLAGAANVPVAAATTFGRW